MIFAVKRCNCCGRMLRSPEEWRALPYVAEQAFEDEILEYRNCSCGSTLVLSLTGVVPGANFDRPESER